MADNISLLFLFTKFTLLNFGQSSVESFRTASNSCTEELQTTLLATFRKHSRNVLQIMPHASRGVYL